MGSLEYHVKHSKTKKPDVHRVLDMPPLIPFDQKTHNKWRRQTHKPLVALMLGYAVDGKSGALDALLHIQDDRVISILNKRQGKETGSVNRNDEYKT